MFRPGVRRALAAVLAVASTLVASASHASITPEASTVVRRYLEATGGASAFATESTTYVRAKVAAFGFSGTFEAWTARPDRRYSRTALGPFKLSEGVTSAAAWRTDPTTGRVVALADHDLVDAIVGTWFEHERWAEPDQAGGAVALAAHERDSSGTWSVLEISAPANLTHGAAGASAAKPRRLWFDERTGLLGRTSSWNDEKQVLTKLSDWRRVGTRLRPFVNETSIAGMPMNRLVATTDSFVTNPSVTTVPFAQPSDEGSAGTVRWLQRDGIATLPFDYRARHIWLKASLDGGPQQDFLFDTGASVTVLDSAFAAEQGIHTEGHMQAAGAGAAGGASFAALRSLRIAAGGDGVEIPDVKVAVLSINPQFAPLFWRKLAGVIGYDVISRFVVTLDYDAARLVLRDPKMFRYEGREKPLPMVMNGTIPALRGTLDGAFEGLFRLDVGSNSTVDLHAPFVKRHALDQHVGKSIPFTGMGFGGEFKSSIGRMHGMKLGPYEWDDPMVLLSGVTQGAFASEDFAGNIGNRILERFRVTLDYSRREVFLEPGARYTARDHLTRSGAQFAWWGDSVTAASVLPNSPARRAGLRPGDHVLRIDGRDALAWDPGSLEKLFEEGDEGRVVPVVVRRNGHDSTLQLKLREVMP